MSTHVHIRITIRQKYTKMARAIMSWLES